MIPDHVKREQERYDRVYPLPCEACGRREEEHRPLVPTGSKVTYLGAWCPCGAYKGPVVERPEDTYRRSRKFASPPPSQTEATVPPRPATPTSVAEIASALDRERPRHPLSPERRFAFMEACAKLGADEHRIRCELASHGEELETCSDEASRAVYRALRATGDVA